MRLSARPHRHGEGDRAFANPAFPCAPHAAPSATYAHSPAWFRRCPLSGAAARAGEATHTRHPRSHTTTRIHVTVNEGVTA
jgi:hypothetical protein